jgi:3-phosphoshikimate 1-carboxyvinyltransferase
VSPTRFDPSGPLRGTLRPPPDKSISHRAALLGAMADGESHITGYLDSADTRATLAAVEGLGAGVELGDTDPTGALELRVAGIGLRGAGERSAPGPVAIDVGNAGTLLRLLPGCLAGQQGGRVEPGGRRVHRAPPGRPRRGAAS